MKRTIYAFVLTASLLGIAFWATAQTGETARASCTDGYLTLSAPRPVDKITVRFVDVARVCMGSTV